MRPRLDIRHLEMIKALTAEPTLAEAAETLGVSPSALSHRIREAERRLDATLYEKRGRKLRPTPAADVLAEAAGRLLDDLARTELLAKGTVAGAHHFVRLAVGVYGSFHWLPGFLPSFRETHPVIDLDVDADMSLAPVERLMHDEVDVVLTPSAIEPVSVERIGLFNDVLVGVVGPDHPYARKKVLTAADFAGETYFTYSFLREPGFESDRFWTPAGERPYREQRIASIHAICEMIHAGLGVSILSRWALEPRLETGSVVAVPLEGDMSITWSALFKAGSARDAPERQVAEALADWFAG